MSSDPFLRDLPAVQKALHADLDLRIFDLPRSATADQVQGLHPEGPGLGLIDGAISAGRMVAPTIKADSPEMNLLRALPMRREEACSQGDEIGGFRAKTGFLLQLAQGPPIDL